MTPREIAEQALRARGIDPTPAGDFTGPLADWPSDSVVVVDTTSIERLRNAGPGAVRAVADALRRAGYMPIRVLGTRTEDVR